MASTDKYCEGCQFFIQSTQGPQYSKCGAPDARRVGGMQFVAAELDVPPYCSTMRMGDCGANAKWFQPKMAEAAE